jgi:hypothetical protein
MYRPTKAEPASREPFVLRHRWLGALIWGTLLMPLGFIAEMLGPPALSRTLSWLRIAGLWLGAVVLDGSAPELLWIGLSLVPYWLAYVLLVRLMLWRIAVGRAERPDSYSRALMAGSSTRIGRRVPRRSSA